MTNVVVVNKNNTGVIVKSDSPGIVSTRDDIFPVIVNNNKSQGIVVKSSSPGELSYESGVILKNTPTLISGGATTLSSLLDVNTSQVVDGATLVYDSSTRTYIVKPLDASDLSGSIDGGLF